MEGDENPSGVGTGWAKNLGLTQGTQAQKQAIPSFTVASLKIVLYLGDEGSSYTISKVVKERS